MVQIIALIISVRNHIETDRFQRIMDVRLTIKQIDYLLLEAVTLLVIDITSILAVLAFKYRLKIVW